MKTRTHKTTVREHTAEQVYENLSTDVGPSIEIYTTFDSRPLARLSITSRYSQVWTTIEATDISGKRARQVHVTLDTSQLDTLIENLTELRKHMKLPQELASETTESTT